MSRRMRRGVMAASRRRAVVPASVRSVVLMGNGQSATTSSLSLSLTGASIGDVACVALTATTATTTLTTPSGWTLDSGPNDYSAQRSWALHKRLVSGDPGSSVTFTLSAAVRCNAAATIVQDGTDTGLVFASFDDSAGGATTSTPTIAGGVANGIYVVHFAWSRAAGTPAPDITVASPYSQVASPRSATNYGTSPEHSTEAAYVQLAAAGSVGGDTLSTVNAGVGFNYAWMIPAA